MIVSQQLILKNRLQEKWQKFLIIGNFEALFAKGKELGQSWYYITVKLLPQTYTQYTIH